MTSTTTTEATTELRLPARFFQDHMNRRNTPEEWDALDASIVRWNTKGVVVRLTDDQLSNLAGDADCTVDAAGEMGWEYRGLGISALATLQALRKAGKSFGY